MIRNATSLHVIITRSSATAEIARVGGHLITPLKVNRLLILVPIESLYATSRVLNNTILYIAPFAFDVIGP